MIRQYIVLEGNPTDGYKHHGPFSTREEAFEWADRWCADLTFVATLLPPEEAIFALT